MAGMSLALSQRYFFHFHLLKHGVPCLYSCRTFSDVQLYAVGVARLVATTSRSHAAINRSLVAHTNEHGRTRYQHWVTFYDASRGQNIVVNW